LKSLTWFVGASWCVSEFLLIDTLILIALSWCCIFTVSFVIVQTKDMTFFLVEIFYLAQRLQNPVQKLLTYFIITGDRHVPED